MPQFHLSYDIPNSHPYDRQDWQLQALGNLAARF